MRTFKTAVAQFEPRDGDKAYNLSVINKLTADARAAGAELISFHELSITAYTFLKNLTRSQIEDLAENVPDGPSTKALIRIAREYDMPVFAGLVEKDEGKLYNTYIGVDQNGLVARHRKLHPFISRFLDAGSHYTVFDLKGWRFGILICYDNNIIENVRATALLGAEIIIAPHVTMCTPSSMPGRGYVDDKLWQNRNLDPVSLRMEFDGPKGREWLLRWLPARAYDNGVYYLFSNPIGYDGEQLKNGNSLIMDPHGAIITEIKSFENAITTATLTSDKLTMAGGWRYRKARRPELYREILGAGHDSATKPIWLIQNGSEPNQH